MDEDDSLVTLALNNGIFSFLNSTFIRNEAIQNEVILHLKMKCDDTIFLFYFLFFTFLFFLNN